MKSILIACLLILFLNSEGQTNQGSNNKHRLDSFYAANNVTYYEGDTVHLGKGSAPNGDFLYLTMGGWAAVAYNNPNRGTDQNNIGRGYYHSNVILKKIRTGKVKGAQRTFFVVGGGNITNYNLDIEAAIESGEVIPGVTKDATKSVQSTNNIAEEIKKLKELLDAGAITQPEYDSSKKKLLEKL